MEGSTEKLHYTRKLKNHTFSKKKHFSAQSSGATFLAQHATKILFGLPHLQLLSTLTVVYLS
jgi:hypothetical protein